MFIAILSYKKPLEDVVRYLQAHRDYLAKHYAAGDFIESGLQTPRVGGVNCRLSDCGVYSDNVLRCYSRNHSLIMPYINKGRAKIRAFKSPLLLL